jgi:alginate O-acetyltransferase complex protein AlgI
MVFSSEVFLFVFLPLVLVAYNVARGAFAKNFVLVVASAVFYAWGEGAYVALVLSSALINFAFGRGLSILPDARRRTRRVLLAVAIAMNLCLLIALKYFGFLGDNLNFLLANTIGRSVSLSQLYLPLGISFFTFHAISYIIDVYRRTCDASRSPLQIILYFAFFPQLIAGPIVRYKDVASQLPARRIEVADLAFGARRFTVGLAKKVLVADTLGRIADRVFGAPAGTVDQPLAWFALAAYTLQIYFDFSGYSDMAIGLARLFGFRFLENFEFPYIAGSVREFWQRWHISLSRWFRDYLYIPLGGSRVPGWRLYVNLLVVFFLCGLWHGAKWTFVVWGLIHGVFLVLERVGLMRRITSTPILRHVYVLSVVAFAWVFFRSASFADAIAFLTGLVRPAAAPSLTFRIVDHETLIVFVAACILSTPVVANRLDPMRSRQHVRNAETATFARALAPLGIAGLFVVSAAKLAGGTYSPFLYFHF